MMKKYAIFMIFALVMCLSGQIMAQTVTEGTLDLERLAKQITGDLQDYTAKRQKLAKQIESVRKSILKLRDDYHRAKTQKQRITIKALTLRETSRLVQLYSQFYNLNIEKARKILPNLEKMREAARKGALGKAARKLRNPEFRRNIATLYSNLSTLALKFNEPTLRKEVAMLLKENELLYGSQNNVSTMYDNIIQNIDRISDRLKSTYAKAMLRSNILRQRKAQLAIAIELMRYALALRPLSTNALELTDKGLTDLPMIDVSEFIEPVLGQGSDTNRSDYVAENPEVEATLRSFQKGPNFLKKGGK